MSKTAKLSINAYGLAVLVVIIDQAAKGWALYGLHLVPGDPVPVLPFFKLTLTSNSGVSYGLLSNGPSLTRWLLSGFSIIVAVVLAVYVRRIDKPLTAAGIGLIIGGAVGNVIDRIRLGAVVDFLDFSALHFPWIFNPADAAITVGVVLFLIELMITPDKKPAGPNRDDHAL
jgi:signal peptidase II